MVLECVQPTQALHPHPSIHSYKVLTVSWKCRKLLCSNPTILFNFRNQQWRQLCSICTHCHCKSGASCVLCGRMDGDRLYSFHLQNLCGVRFEEDRCFTHIDNVFFHYLSYLLFPCLLHEIKCIWCCLHMRALRFISTHTVSQSLWLQPPVDNQWLCTIWFGMENLTQYRCLSWHNSCHHYHSLLMKLKDIPKKKIVNRHQ